MLNVTKLNNDICHTVCHLRLVSNIYFTNALLKLTFCNIFKVSVAKRRLQNVYFQMNKTVHQ